MTAPKPDVDAIEARLKGHQSKPWYMSGYPGIAPDDVAALLAYVRELEGRITEAATLQQCLLCGRRPYRFSVAVDPCECLGGKCRCDGCAAYRELAHGDALSTLPSASAWQCGLCDQIASNAPEAVRLPKHSPRCTQRANGGGNG